MPLTNIPANYFYTKATIQRRSLSVDTVGDPVETWNNIATNVPITIQPINEKEKKNALQGKEFTAEHKAYCPIDIVLIKHGDRLISQKDSRTYNIIGVEEHRASRADVTTGQHYKLFLEIPKTTKS